MNEELSKEEKREVEWEIVRLKLEKEKVEKEIKRLTELLGGNHDL